MKKNNRNSYQIKALINKNISLQSKQLGTNIFQVGNKLF